MVRFVAGALIELTSVTVFASNLSKPEVEAISAAVSGIGGTIAKIVIKKLRSSRRRRRRSKRGYRCSQGDQLLRTGPTGLGAGYTWFWSVCPELERRDTGHSYDIVGRLSCLSQFVNNRLRSLRLPLFPITQGGLRILNQRNHDIYQFRLNNATDGKSEILERLAEHYRNLLNHPSTVAVAAIDRLPQMETNNDLDMSPPLPKNNHCVHQLSSEEASEFDVIPAEVYKNGAFNSEDSRSSKPTGISPLASSSTGSLKVGVDLDATAEPPT
nr:unnamed protein product [Spirometra erinaceieuropaei]